MSSEPEEGQYPRTKSLTSIPKPILVSLLFYIGTLAATQTIYGRPLMSLRWVALGVLTLFSFIYWLLGRIAREDRVGHRGDPVVVFIYLGATLLSVAAAENFKFSGLRWMTQGMLIVSCMVFLRGTFNPGKMEDLLVPLKVVGLILLLLSFLLPAPLNIYDNPYFRGAMGDSNSFGHVSAICTLIFLQGAITGRSRSGRVLQWAVAALAMIMLIRSGARSSMAAFLVGFIIINYYFRLSRSLLTKGILFLVLAFVLASPTIYEKMGSLVTKEDWKMEKESGAVAFETYFKTGLLPVSLFPTRERLWSEAWEGFMRRPILGWGFGANSDIPDKWSIKPTAVGMTRDITNDMLFILEGSGLVGFLAYLALIFSILRQSPTRQELLLIRSSLRRRKGLFSIPADAEAPVSKNLPGLWPDDGRPGKGGAGNTLDELTVSKAYVHLQMYILSVSLFVLFLLDGSAFSAGSLISAIFWVSAGAANLTRTEVVAGERIDRRVMNGLKNSRGQGFK